MSGGQMLFFSKKEPQSTLSEDAALYAEKIMNDSSDITRKIIKELCQSNPLQREIIRSAVAKYKSI